MDQRIKNKLQQFDKALSTLKECLDADIKNNLFVRDSAIQRFEYSVELSWKILKLFLSERFGNDVFSPKECFRSLLTNKLITAGETELFLTMIDDRNLASHTYDETFIEKLILKLPDYYQGMGKIADLIRENKPEY